MARVTINESLRAHAHESITVSSTPIGITATLLVSTPTTNNPYSSARHAVEALLTVETDAIRYTLDGTTVSDTVGHKLDAGDELIVQGHGNLSKLRMAKVTNDAAVKVTVFNRA